MSEHLSPIFSLHIFSLHTCDSHKSLASRILCRNELAFDVDSFDADSIDADWLDADSLDTDLFACASWSAEEATTEMVLKAISAKKIFISPTIIWGERQLKNQIKKLDLKLKLRLQLKNFAKETAELYCIRCPWL